MNIIKKWFRKRRIIKLAEESDKPFPQSFVEAFAQVLVSNAHSKCYPNNDECWKDIIDEARRAADIESKRKLLLDE